MTTGPRWELDKEKKTVTIIFQTIPPAVLRINVSEVEEILKNLGDYRAAMSPAVPTVFTPDGTVMAIVDPNWQTEPELRDGEPLLHIRDPRFGWLHYKLPRQEAAKLAGFLQEQADAPPPATAPGKAN